MSDEVTRDGLPDEIGHLIQERCGEFLTANPECEMETPSAGVLTGWFLVTQWVGDDGMKWLAYHHNHEQAPWEARGLLSEALSDL